MTATPPTTPTFRYYNWIKLIVGIVLLVVGGIGLFVPLSDNAYTGPVLLSFGGVAVFDALWYILGKTR